MESNTATRSRMSVSVWLPLAAHTQLEHWRGSGEADGAGSLAMLVRAAGAAAVAAPGGRVNLAAPDAAAVDQLRTSGYRLNGLVAALNEGLGGVTGVAGPRATVAWHRAVAARIAPVLGEVIDAAAAVRLRPLKNRPEDGQMMAGEQPWKLVRVTTDPGTVARWELAAKAAGFRSVANWLRDGLAGVHQLPIARPPALATIDARSVVGRVSGLIAQVQLAADEIAVIDRVCGPVAERAGEALAMSLDSLVVYGGDVKARR